MRYVIKYRFALLSKFDFPKDDLNISVFFFNLKYSRDIKCIILNWSIRRVVVIYDRATVTTILSNTSYRYITNNSHHVSNTPSYVTNTPHYVTNITQHINNTPTTCRYDPTHTINTSHVTYPTAPLSIIVNKNCV